MKFNSIDLAESQHLQDSGFYPDYVSTKSQTLIKTHIQISALAVLYEDVFYMFLLFCAFGIDVSVCFAFFISVYFCFNNKYIGLHTDWNFSLSIPPHCPSVIHLKTDEKSHLLSQFLFCSHSSILRLKTVKWRAERRNQTKNSFRSAHTQMPCFISSLCSSFGSPLHYSF